MNSYVSDPYINKMATDGGGGVVNGSVNWLRARYWSLVQIPTRIQFSFANFHVTAILAISTYRKPNIWFQKGDI
jgi:hypothetical protein